MKNNPNDILDELYDSYFLQNKSSAVTSSHWKEIGGHKVRKENGNLKLEGFGFGAFRKNSLKYKMYFSLELLLTKGIEKRFLRDQELKAAAMLEDFFYLDSNLFGIDPLLQDIVC